jgi:hypothetical protein
MKRTYDTRTGRPLSDGRDRVDVLTDEELEVEATVAAYEGRRRAARLDALLLERARRRADSARSTQPA